MEYSIHSIPHDITVTYHRCDGYKAKRAAILLARQIEEAGEGAAALGGYAFKITFAEQRSGDYQIKVTDKVCEITVGGIFAGALALNLIDKLVPHLHKLAGVEQEKFKMSLVHFMMPESKEEFKGRQRHFERAQVPCERAPNG